MNPSLDDNAGKGPDYSEEMTREAKRSEQWHRGSIIGLAVTIIGYLLATFVPAPKFLEITFVVAAFLFTLAYMGTTIWVYSLRSERKRSTKSGTENGSPEA